MPKYYRRKSYFHTSIPFLMMLLLLLSAVFIPTLIHNPQVFLQEIVISIIFIGVIVFSITVIFLRIFETKRKARMQALQIADIDRMTGAEFEKYVGLLIQSQGYSVTFTAGSGDYGVDMIAEKDHQRYAIQVKRYTATVGSHAIAEAVGGLAQYHAHKAVVITSNYFTPHALILATANNCILIDRDKLAEWILAFQSKSDKNCTFE